ncbi:hypothetical protein BDD12DRAFT_805957 [Trichophaea hybrida]|nr:hypothetical protein BDD12DRAFT_805957 [Trichophaea hybrida]
MVEPVTLIPNGGHINSSGNPIEQANLMSFNYTDGQYRVEYITLRWVYIVHRIPMHVTAGDYTQLNIWHNMQIGIFDHITTCNEFFLQPCVKLMVVDVIWAGTPPFSSFWHSGKEMSQGSGKKMGNFSQPIYQAMAGGFHHPLPHHREVIHTVLCCAQSLVNWSLAVQAQIHTAETCYYLVNYLAEFNATMNIFATYRTAMATTSIAPIHRENQQIQPNYEDDIEDEEMGRIQRSSFLCPISSSAKCKSVQKLHANLPDTPVDLTGAPK